MLEEEIKGERNGDGWWATRGQWERLGHVMVAMTPVLVQVSLEAGERRLTKVDAMDGGEDAAGFPKIPADYRNTYIPMSADPFANPQPQH